MALKIRLRQQGRTNHTVYRLVVTDSRSPRDGKYVELLGWYNPIAKEEEQISLNEERIQYWLGLGAQLTEKVTCLIKANAPAITEQLTAKKLALKAKEAQKRKAKKAVA